MPATPKQLEEIVVMLENISECDITLIRGSDSSENIHVTRHMKTDIIRYLQILDENIEKMKKKGVLYFLSTELESVEEKKKFIVDGLEIESFNGKDFRLKMHALHECIRDVYEKAEKNNNEEYISEHIGILKVVVKLLYEKVTNYPMPESQIDSNTLGEIVALNKELFELHLKKIGGTTLIDWKKENDSLQPKFSKIYHKLKTDGCSVGDVKKIFIRSTKTIGTQGIQKIEKYKFHVFVELKIDSWIDGLLFYSFCEKDTDNAIKTKLNSLYLEIIVAAGVIIDSERSFPTRRYARIVSIRDQYNYKYIQLMHESFGCGISNEEFEVAFKYKFSTRELRDFFYQLMRESMSLHDR